MRQRENMVLFDANMILRYLLNDNAEMAEEAEKNLNQNTAAVTIEVIVEVVYVRNYSVRGYLDSHEDGETTVFFQVGTISRTFAGHY